MDPKSKRTRYMPKINKAVYTYTYICNSNICVYVFGDIGNIYTISKFIVYYTIRNVDGTR